MASAARASGSTSWTSTAAEFRPVDDPDLLTIGRIGKPRGVRGDVFVASWTDDPHDRFAVGSVLQTAPSERGPLTVSAMSTASGKLVVHFDGFDSREAAESLRGIDVVMRAGERPPLEDPDDFYDTDLVGLVARTVSGAELGPVREVLHAGATDYLVLDVSGTEQLVPFVAAIVPTIDVAGGFVEIDPPEGLLDL
jgi:16S rRNA processing protein RimM